MKKIKYILLVVAIFFILFFAPLYFLVFHSHIHEDILKKEGVYDKLGKQKTNQLYANIIFFLNDKENLSEDFQDNEKEHLVDVKNYFFALKILLLLSVVTILIIFLIHPQPKKSKKRYKNTLIILFRAMRTASLIVLLLVSVLLLSFLSHFEFIFDIFHKIFFFWGNWQFPPDSILIILLPLSFFEVFAKTWLAVCAIVSFFLLLTSLISLLIIKRPLS